MNFRTRGAPGGELENDGYFVVEGFLLPEEVRELREATRLLPQLLKGGEASDWVPTGPGVGVRAVGD